MQASEEIAIVLGKIIGGAKIDDVISELDELVERHPSVIPTLQQGALLGPSNEPRSAAADAFLDRLARQPVAGRSLRVMREQMSLTQQQLANMLGCARTELSRYETGERKIPLDYMHRAIDLAAEHGVDLAGPLPERPRLSGASIKWLQHHLGVSRDELAAHLGLSRGTLNIYCTRRYVPDPFAERVVKFARTRSIDLPELKLAA
jgi:transcriptional regulator with XRE-family HTH domain